MRGWVSSVFFLELSTRINRIGGRVGILTPNKWFRSAYGEPVRKLLRKRTRVRLLVDCGHSKTLFPGADTFPAAVSLELVENTVADEKTFEALDASDARRREYPLKELLRTTAIPVPHRHLSSHGWRLQDRATFSLIEKIQHTGAALERVIGTPPLFGIKTGYNQAFVIEEAQREALLTMAPESAELIKPFARGRDIGRWCCKPTQQWLLLVPSSANRIWPWSHLDARAAEDCFRESYPAIYAHLEEHEKKLKARADQGRFWWELRSCDYYNTFEAPKIVVGDIAWRAEFAIDKGGIFAGNAIYIVPTNDPFVLAVLNSRIMWWFFYHTAQPAKDDARRYIGILGNMPIPTSPPQDLRDAIVNLTSEIVVHSSQSQVDVKETLRLETHLNDLVEKAFELTSNEKATLSRTLPPRDPLVLAANAVEKEALEIAS